MKETTKYTKAPDEKETPNSCYMRREYQKNVFRREAHNGLYMFAYYEVQFN